MAGVLTPASPGALQYDELQFESDADWIQARRQFVGSSEIAALFGLGYASQSPYSIWLEKTKGIAVPFSESDSDVLEYGKMAEPFIRKVFQFKTGHFVHSDADPVIRQSRLWPDIGATIDGWIEIDGRCEVTELKYIGRHQAYDFGNGVPHKYQLQIQHQLACTGWDRGWLMALCANEPFIFEVERHEKLIELIVSKADWFMRLVESGTPPEIDSSKATAAALLNQFPNPTPKKVARLSEKHHRFGEVLARVKERRKRAEELEREMTSRIQAAMGDAELGYTDSGLAWSWNATKRSRTFRFTSAYRKEVLEHKANGGE